jgi:hypothetical protein
MAEKLSFIDSMDDSLCFSLHECQDEVTSEFCGNSFCVALLDLVVCSRARLEG